MPLGTPTHFEFYYKDATQELTLLHFAVDGRV
jgi:hypothetical protein